MKSSFKDIDTGETETPEAAQAPAVSDTNTESAVVTDDFWDQEPEIDQDLVRTPRIDLCHAVGFATEAGFSAGSIVYNRETILAKPTKTEIAPADAITVYPLKWYTVYEEVLTNAEFEARRESGEKTLSFRSEQEARNAGFISQKEKKANPARQEPVMHPIMHLMCLVETPGEGAQELPLEFEGKRYGVAELLLKKGSYWTLGSALMTHFNNARAFTKQPIWSKGFKIGAKYAAFGAGKPSWSLTDMGRKTPTPAFVEWAKSLIG